MMAQQQPTAEDARESSLGELVKQLSEDTSTLIRQELDLAKAELTAAGKKAGVGAGLLGAGGIMALFALATFTAFLVLLLAEAMPGWVAALVVAAAYGAVAALLALRGRDKVKEATPPAPQTIETVKEDVAWAKNPTSSARR